MQVVWFKRDLRVSDHRPLVEASRRGPAIGLYIYEPAVIQAHDFDASHLGFINESLAELRANLESRGGALLIRCGDAVWTLDELHRTHGIDGLWSHEETGTLAIYERDRAVKRWTKEQGIRWTELLQNGVVRPLRSRDGWSGLWHERMREALTPAPERLQGPRVQDAGRILSAADLRLVESRRSRVQQGGESRAHETLDSFLTARGVNYRQDMSSPLTGESGFSRISPYLAWGNISIRQVFQASVERRAEIEQLITDGGDVDRRWAASLASFNSRLRWHCHFMQKLEDQPDLEQTNMCRAYDGLREDDFNPEYFAAWREGRTGYPMVDACMRAMHETGWINFRMRAMLVSFACYHLCLHWKPVADYLAPLFLDYEPGIHYSQTQMQAGVTGINTIRIYSPAKQVVDQDPEGVFVRRGLPELERIPNEYLPEPHKMPAEVQRKSGCVISKDYPAPVVDHARAYKAARERMYSLKSQAKTRKEAKKVYVKHGSRKRPRAAAS